VCSYLHKCPRSEVLSDNHNHTRIQQVPRIIVPLSTWMKFLV
jgi:hypothetical protein